MPYQEPTERGMIEIVTHTHKSCERRIAGVWWQHQQRLLYWGQQPSTDLQHILLPLGMRSE